MGVIRGLLTGFTISSLCIVAYTQQIYSTSSYLRKTLTSLTRDLDSLRIHSTTDDVAIVPKQRAELDVGEQVKVQWNDQLFRTMNGLYTTEWSSIAAKAYRLAKAEAKSLQERLSQ